MANRSSQFRLFAQKSRDAAAGACPPEARELLLEIAVHWDELAALIERAETLLPPRHRAGPGKPD